jgi:hypothetical protein
VKQLKSACLVMFTMAACSPPPPKSPETGTSFQEGVRRLCEVDQRAGLDPDLDPVTIEGERYEWAIGHVEHPDVIELVTILRVRSEAERVEMLRSFARQAELASCPLADTIEASL